MTAHGTDMQIVVFRVGVEQYALPTTAAREVINYEMPRRLPGADPWVEGVINLRGEIIPVCNLMRALGTAADCEDAVSAHSKTIICDSEAGSVGLVVDEVTAVLTITPNELDRPSSMSHPALVGVIRLDDTLVVLLELEHVLSGESLTSRPAVEDTGQDVPTLEEQAA